MLACEHGVVRAASAAWRERLCIGERLCASASACATRVSVRRLDACSSSGAVGLERIVRTRF